MAKEIYDKKNTFRKNYKSSGKYYWSNICILEDGTENIVGASHRGFDSAEDRDENYQFNIISGWEEEEK